MNTPSNQIPLVPEGALDPAAGLNDALNVIDVLLQAAVINMTETTPPATNADGDRYIVASPATGDWTGEENNLARYVLEGDFWEFYEAGTQVHYVLNLDDGTMYAWSINSPVEWTAIGGGGSGTAESGHGVLSTITSASNVADMDHSLGADFTLTLTENVTTFTHSNEEVGEANWFTMRINAGAGGFTFAPPASWRYGSGVSAYTASSGAGDIDLIQGVSYDDGTTWMITYLKDFT